MKPLAIWAGFAVFLIAGTLLGAALPYSLRGIDPETRFVDPRLTGMDTADAPIWSNDLMWRMGWVSGSGRIEGKKASDSVAAIDDGLDSAKPLPHWSTLALIRLQGQLGWECRGCAAVFREQRPLVAVTRNGGEVLAQLRTPEGRLLGWMSLDTATLWSLHFFVDHRYRQESDSSDAAFLRRVRDESREYVRRREGGTPEPKERRWIVRETDLMGQFRHFSTRVVDLDLQEHLRKFDTLSIDSVRLARQVESTPVRRISQEEHGVIGLAGEIGLQSKACYRRVSNGEIFFRSRRTGAHLVTSAWNSSGKPVAWNAIDSGWGPAMPIWFHLDRQACLESTDSVIPRPSLFRRIFHLQ